MERNELIEQLAIHAPPAPVNWFDDRGKLRSNIAIEDLADWPWYFADMAYACHVAFDARRAPRRRKLAGAT